MDYSRYRSLRIERTAPGVAELIMGEDGRLPAADARGHGELAAIWRDIDRDPDISVVIVRGQEKGFSAGGTLELVGAMAEHFEDRARVWREARELVMNMVDCSKIVISAISGPAVGGGLAVALMADIPVAARNARLIDGHTRLGVAAGGPALVHDPARQRDQDDRGDPARAMRPGGRLGVLQLALAHGREGPCDHRPADHHDDHVEDGHVAAVVPPPATVDHHDAVGHQRPLHHDAVATVRPVVDVAGHAGVELATPLVHTFEGVAALAAAVGRGVQRDDDGIQPLGRTVAVEQQGGAPQQPGQADAEPHGCILGPEEPAAPAPLVRTHPGDVRRFAHRRCARAGRMAG